MNNCNKLRYLFEIKKNGTGDTGSRQNHFRIDHYEFPFWSDRDIILETVSSFV